MDQTYNAPKMPVMVGVATYETKKRLTVPLHVRTNNAARRERGRTYSVCGTNIDKVRVHQLTESKPWIKITNPKMESMLVCVNKMSSAKKLDTSIMNKILASTVRQVQACLCTRS